MPKRNLDGRFTVAAVVHSVSPYPSRMSTSSEWKNSAISFESGAPPEIPMRKFPPSCALTFE